MSDKGNPNISQYFSNNSPSLFDDLVKPESVINNSSQPGPDEFLSVQNVNNSNYTFDYLEYEKSSQLKTNVPDHVKDLWEPPYSSEISGIPPSLTMPGTQLATDLTDHIRESVSLLLGEEEASIRKILTADDVTQDDRGLRQLIEDGFFRSAVNLTGRLLTIYGQGFGKVGHPSKHTPHSLQLWFTRLALLIKLEKYDICATEAEPFDNLDRHDVFYEFYPELSNGKRGSMASFSFRLLLAELPMYLNESKRALDKLTDLYAICLEIKNHCTKIATEDVKSLEAKKFWAKREKRTLHSIINCALKMKDYSLVKSIMSQLLEDPDIDILERRSLHSAFGRIYLQCGDIFSAEKQFSDSKKLKEQSNSSPDLRELIDKGLRAVAQNDFQEAFTSFQKALTLSPSNIMLYNNMGVCLLYSGKLKEAIALYENAIQGNTMHTLNENLLLNLSTLYELESNNPRTKKIELLRQINKYKGDLVQSLEQCLKLQATSITDI